MRFDRPPGDVFAVQDEIAMQVARALELSLDANATDRLTGQGTSNLDAYLAYLQGRSLLANDRVVDMREAIAQFERSIDLDPKFAAAYVSLAEAELFVAEYDVTDDRTERFDRALVHGRELVDKALKLDPENGDAYLQRAHLTAFDDLQAAAADYRRGLELSPNSARGYAGPGRGAVRGPAAARRGTRAAGRRASSTRSSRATTCTKAVFLHYERGDAQAAVALLTEVIERNPNYLPALVRLCEIDSYGTGREAQGVSYCERALAVDPLSEETRRLLTKAYLDLGDEHAAADVAGDPSRRADVAQMQLLMFRKQWLQAGEVAYEVLDRRTDSPHTLGMILGAVRMHARATSDYARATAAIEQVAAVSWSESGAPILRNPSTLRDAEIALGDILLHGENPDRGRKLLTAIVERMDHDLRDLKRPEYWYYRWHPVALALLGRRDAALSMLERADAGTPAGHSMVVVSRSGPGLRQSAS